MKDPLCTVEGVAKLYQYFYVKLMAEYLDSYNDESEKSIQHDQLGFLCYQPGRLPSCAFPP